MEIDVSQYRSRAKEGKASWCVDTRALVHNGKQEFFKTKAEAKVYAKHVAAEISPASSQAWDWTFKQLCDSYLAYVQQEFDDGEIKRSNMLEKKRHARCFVKLTLDNHKLTSYKVRDLTAGQIKLQLMNQLKKDRTIKTVKNIMGNVRLMFDHAIDSGCRNSNPALGVKAKGSKGAGKGLAVKPNESMIDNVIAHMTPVWQLRAEFAATTGLRQGEQRALLWADLVDHDFKKVDVNKAVEHRAGVGDTKTPAGKRKVPLKPDVAKKMKELWMAEGRPMKGLVFPSRTGHVLSDSRFLPAIHAACDAAGVARIRWHDLRHYYASKLLQKFPGDWWTVTNLMGHESIKTTTEIYGHWLEDEARDQEIADKMWGPS